MKLSHFTLFALTVASLVAPLTSSAQSKQSERAYAATTLNEARSGFQAMYGFSATDCDPINGEWVCSEFHVSATTLLSLPEPTDDSTANCVAYGASIDDAQSAFSADCPWRIRHSCDLLSSGQWACTTEGADSQSLVTVAGAPPPPAGLCAAHGASITEAQEAFSVECPWRDRNFCDPQSSGEWACSTERLATSVNALDTSPETTHTADSSTSNTSTDTADTSTESTRNTAQVLQIEAEDVAYNSAVWRPSEGGLVYTGANRYLLTSRNDDANLVLNFAVPVAGTYRFTMRSRAGKGNDPSEPPNDVWLKAPGQDWLKVYMTRDGSWHIDAIGERNGSHSRDFNTYQLSAGSHQMIVSGRSQGHILDWVALQPQGFSIDSSTTNTPVVSNTTGTGVLNTYYQSGDLVVIAHDSGPDTDDMQAIVANRMIMDANPSVNYLLVGATQGHAWTNPTAGSEAHTQSLFPDWVNAKASTSGTTSFDGTSVIAVADRIESTLNSGGTVHIAEGGPSDFTAEILRLLQSRGVSAGNLKRIRVVQHSAGSTAWNEQQTSSANIALVKSVATWTPIANGNVGGNATADFQETASSAMCQRFRSAAAGSRYASQWAWAYSTIGDSRKCDQSDSVELLYILNDTSTKTFDQFVSRYM
ncbi:MAG: hypothetical protein AB8B84_03685 [Granulosicoccus sp.]